jgi:hypothetical protein
MAKEDRLVSGSLVVLSSLIAADAVPKAFPVGLETVETVIDDQDSLRGCPKSLYVG